MNKYPRDPTETVNRHTPKLRVLWVVVGVVVIAVVALGVLAYTHRPTIGTVTAVSAARITIRPNGSATTTVFRITNTTAMGVPKSASNPYDMRPQPFNASDIHIGESVIVQAGASGHQAELVTINPQQ